MPQLRTLLAWFGYDSEYPTDIMTFAPDPKGVVPKPPTAIPDITPDL